MNETYKIQGVRFYATVAFAVTFALCRTGLAQPIVAWGGDDPDGETKVPPGITNPIAISAGTFNNLVLQPNGALVAFGDNTYGETNIPTAATNIIGIAAGGLFDLALRNDGTVIAWGRNSSGQTNVPLSATNVVAIAAGESDGLALRADGTVVAWGDNTYGQTNTPPNLADVIAIAAGYYHNLALRSDRSIVAWGSQNIIPASLTNAIAISAGWENSLALLNNGRVVAWGDDSYGQCSVPVSISNATAIKAGFGHCLALLSDGTVVAWGKNYLGLTNVPAGLQNVAAISCGEDHDLALAGFGAPQIQLEPQTATPHVGGVGLLKADLTGTLPMACQWYLNAAPVPAATNSWLLFAGLQATHAGTYTLIASNNVSQTTSASLIYDIASTPYFLTPVPVPLNAMAGTPLLLSVNAEGVPPLAYQSQLNGVNLAHQGSISGTASPNLSFNPCAFQDSGWLTTIVTNNYGSYTGVVANLAVTPIIGWGDNSLGQLRVPATVNNIVSVVCGGDHSLALLADGTLVGWGNDSFNQDSIPASANQVAALAEGDTHSLALNSNGSVVAWGDNSSGQTNVPATVTNAVAIAAGAGYSQALLPNGTIIQWGTLHYLSSSFTNVLLLSSKGNHTIAVRADGTIVDNLESSVPCANPIAVCAGVNNGLALFADGTLAAWGTSLFGQTNLPPAATNIVAIAAGDDHFVALRSDGMVVAWGDNRYAQCPAPALNQSVGSIAAGSVHSLAVQGQPLERTARAGGSTTFSAGPYASRLATYQWQLNGTNLSGATNSTLVLTNLSATIAGVYRVVIDNPLGSETSPAMTLAVSSLTLEVAALNMVAANGAFQFAITGSAGQYPVTIYASSNLLGWVPIFTNPPTTGTINFTDTPPSLAPQRFYRAIEQP